MNLIDTHTHLYLPHFDDDIELVIRHAGEMNVVKMLLPNIDLDSVGPMLKLCSMFPDKCFPMLGLHPSSVKKDYRQQISQLGPMAKREKFVAIGETGMDAYWDKEFLAEQEDSFMIHLEWAKKLNLPVVIHTREAMDRVISILQSNRGQGLKGVFHAFSGSVDQALEITELGFKIGVGGVVTYKNSGLAPIIKEIDLKEIVLETDSPYLTPVPYRGKRNESAYLVHIAGKIAEIKDLAVEEVALATTVNAFELFTLIN